MPLRRHRRRETATRLIPRIRETIFLMTKFSACCWGQLGKINYYAQVSTKNSLRDHRGHSYKYGRARTGQNGLERARTRMQTSSRIIGTPAKDNKPESQLRPFQDFHYPLASCHPAILPSCHPAILPSAMQTKSTNSLRIFFCSSSQY